MLELTGERVVRYGHPLRVYAVEIWPGKDVKSSVRTLKRWVAKGKAASDLPPFDDKQRLAAWYERHHRHDQAPEALRRFEIAESEPAAPPPGADEVPGGDDLSPMVIDHETEITADTGLRQIRALANATYEQLELELKRGRTVQAAALRREWQSLIATQRQWEVAIMKIQEGKGEVLRTRVVNSELVRIFTTLGQSFFNALDKVLLDHAPTIPAEDRPNVALEMKDNALLLLRGSRFEKSWKPDPS